MSISAALLITLWMKNVISAEVCGMCFQADNDPGAEAPLSDTSDCGAAS